MTPFLRDRFLLSSFCFLETKYKVRVVTGDVRGAGTDANCYIKIFGDQGESKELHLKDSETNPSNKFERKSVDVFSYTMHNLGDLSKVCIWHDNRYPGAGWYLQSVEIVDVTTKESWSFPCDRWLAKDEDDKQISRTLTPGNDYK